jgi:hypothetical protein
LALKVCAYKDIYIYEVIKRTKTGGRKKAHQIKQQSSEEN